MNEAHTRSPSAMTTGADAALKRAARRALQLARETGTPCWVLKNGRLVDIAKSATTPRRATRTVKLRKGG